MFIDSLRTSVDVNNVSLPGVGGCDVDAVGCSNTRRMDAELRLTQITSLIFLKLTKLLAMKSFNPF